MIKTDPGFSRGCNNPTDEQQRAAQLVTCAHAQDANDAALLLNILGLLSASVDLAQHEVDSEDDAAGERR